MNPNILIGTPAYNSMVHMDHENSMLDFHRNKLPITLMSVGNESLITRARNTIISHFYTMKQFTHLLFLDADMYLDSKGLISLIQHNVDVIGAPVVLKGLDANGNKVYNVGKIIEDSENLVSVDRVGTAVFLLSRKAVNALVDDAEKSGNIYGGNPHTRGHKNNILMYDIFRVGVVNGEYLSEDYFVCFKLRELGFKVYVDKNVRTIHNGMMPLDLYR